MTGEELAVPVNVRSGRGMIVAAVVVTVAMFLGASCAVLARLQQIQHDSRTIVTNAVPSVEALSAARRTLRGIAVAISEMDGVAPAAHTLVALPRAVSRLEVLANEYLALPAFPGERENWSLVRACIEDLRSAFDHLDPSNPVMPSPEEQARLKAAIDRADAVLDAMMMRNADEIRAFVENIESTRASALRRAVLLNGIGTVLAGVLLAVALVMLRRRVTAEQHVQRLLEDRAVELEAFAARVAHDLVSPLTPTVLWLERLREAPDAATRNAAERAQRGVNRVTELVEALFTFARAPREAQPAASSDLDAVAREVLASFEELAATRDVTLELESPGPVPLDIHAGIVSSVLGNLVQNAIRYLGDATVRRVTVRIQRLDGRARVDVTDTGPGVPPELQERIFDPYYRAARRDQPLGLGLGLATAKRLVVAHGGAIGVVSAGAGSTFWFELERR